MAGMYNFNTPAAFMPNQPAQVNGGSMTIFVDDENVAATYPVGRGYVVTLLCLPAKKMFVKSTDANGIPQTTRVFEINEITPPQGADMVSRKEFDELKANMQQLLSALKNPTGGEAK